MQGKGFGQTEVSTLIVDFCTDNTTAWKEAKAQPWEYRARPVKGPGLQPVSPREEAVRDPATSWDTLLQRYEMPEQLSSYYSESPLVQIVWEFTEKQVVIGEVCMPLGQ